MHRRIEPQDVYDFLMWVRDHEASDRFTRIRI